MQADRAQFTPVHILTGFLGSGKTTLLNRVLSTEAFSTCAVIVNEFGDIGLDHLLVESSNETLVELAGGCVCCTVRGDLAATIISLLEQRARGQCSAFTRIVIETTGLADTNPIVNLFSTDQTLVERTKLVGVTTTVDAINWHTTLAQFDESQRQVILADQLVVTKTDMLHAFTDPPSLTKSAAEDLDTAVLPDLRERLSALNPHAELQVAARTDAELAKLLLSEHQAPQLGDAHYPHQAQVHGHTHHHTSAIQSFCVTRTDALHPAVVSLLAEALAAHLGTNLLRLKGLLKLRNQEQAPAVIHAAQHVFHPLDSLQAWPAGEPRATRLTFIVRGVPQAFVEDLLDMLIWEVDEIERKVPVASAS